MVRKLFIAPPDIPDDTVTRCLVIPYSQEWLGVINAALLLITEYWNYEQLYDTDLTPEQAATAGLLIYEQYANLDCGSAACTPVLEAAFDIDIGITLRIIRRGAGGFAEEFVDGEWQAPTGDYEVPDPDPRTESTSDEKICAAAANAINVLEQTYEEATDAYNSFGTEAAVAEAILDVIALILGAFGQATAASAISFGNTVFSTFFDVFGLITGDYWTSAYTNELECVFIDAATLTGSTVTFDYPAIDQALLEMQYAAGVALSRQLVLTQTRYLLSIIMAGGLNVAGGTTEVVSPNCDQCYPWSITWDFTTGANGSTGVAYSGCTSTRNASGWGACSNGSVWSMNVRRDISPTNAATHITKVTVEWQPWAVGCDERATSFVRVFHGAGSFDVPVNNNPSSGAVQTSVVSGVDVASPSRFELVWNGTGFTGLYWRKLTIEGYGPMPS